MNERFTKLPASLSEHARTVLLPGTKIPALLIHPDWITPAPVVLWMHGRTAYKELDPGRYARWLRAGIAACAIDLPGHGERRDARAENASQTLEILREALPEVDRVVLALGDPVFQGVFDLDRSGIGGMSLGGMVALRRLCDPHGFRCAAVEGTTGDLGGLYAADGPRPWGVTHAAEEVVPLDAARHLEGFRPIPLLALHSEADRIVPMSVQRGFLDRLRARYVEAGADPGLIEVRTWARTGAPEEHSGFGSVSHEAKTAQAAFFVRHLRVG